MRPAYIINTIILVVAAFMMGAFVANITMKHVLQCQCDSSQQSQEVTP